MSAHALVFDDPLVGAFETCTLARDAFRHRDHVDVVWSYVRALPFEEAALRFVTNLRAFAAHHGASQKFRATITWAYLAGVAEACEGAPEEETFETFERRAAHLFARTRITDLYGPGVMASERVRAVFVLPQREAGRSSRTRTKMASTSGPGSPSAAPTSRNIRSSSGASPSAQATTSAVSSAGARR